MFFGIRDPGWEKIQIWDKHPGSATLADRQQHPHGVSQADRQPNIRMEFHMLTGSLTSAWSFTG